MDNEEKGVSLQETIAKGLRYKNAILTKHEISSWLGHTFKDGVDRIERPLTTKAGKNGMVLPLADTHYVVKNGKKICFAFVYELEETNSGFLLIKMDKPLYEEVKTIYPNLELSSFPRATKDHRWYAVILDDQFKSKLDVYTLLGYAYKSCYGESVEEGLSLKESMELAYTTAGFAITKKEIGQWLGETYKDVELNYRDLYVGGGNKGLPLADTHYRINKDGKKTCFAYVYQLSNGNVFMLLKMNDANFEGLKEFCRDVRLSAFPKSYGDKWYTAIIDKSFIDKKQVFHLIEFAYEHVFDTDED